jgi:hypothetical protein
MSLPTHTRQLSIAFLITCVVGAACSKSEQSGGGDPRGTGGGGGISASGGKSGSGGTSSGSGGTSAGSGGTSSGSGGIGSGGSSVGSGGAGSGGLTGTGGAAAGTGGMSGDDAATPADSSPGGDMPSGGPLPTAVRKVVILHDANAGASATDPSRKSMEDILNSMKESHGVVVEWMNSPTKASELMDKALIIVGPNSSMFGANHPDPGLKTIPVPLMVSKDGNTTEIGLGKVSATAPPNYNKINLVKTDHPLAAGLAMGTLTVLTTPNAQRIITFTGLGPDAIKIATGPQSPDTWSIIAYEKGGDMGGGVKAPAKRVGFFWHRPAAATPEGAKLLKASVDWLLRP